MTTLEKSLSQGRFTVTVELSPPKGTDTASLKEQVRTLAPLATAFNITDNQSAMLHLSSLAAGILVRQSGSEVIYQVTGRDRNRLALQSDLLAASVFGLGNVLALTGDHVTCGDHPGAMPVFDLDSVHILQTIATLNSGRDLGGGRLKGATALFPGAAVAPDYEPFDLQWMKFEKKVEAGARFFQTQALFQVSSLERLVRRAESHRVYILAGILLIKSPGMANYINRNVPGLTIPDAVIERLKAARDPLREGIDIAVEQIREYRALCHGVHIMTAGREDLVAQILARI